MLKIKRLSHATLMTSRMDQQIEHYTDVVGLVLSARDSERAYLSTNVGQLALVLETSDMPMCAALAFEISADAEARDIVNSLKAQGLSPEQMSDAAPGIGRTIVCHDQKGTRIELFSAWDFLDRGPSVGGAVPLKLGHAAFGVPDPQAITSFYETVFGFKVSDWIGDMFSFLRCNVDHHTINFIRAPTVRLHHLAFELRDAAHIHNSSDLLGQRNIPLVWGPVRHGPGHNLATYHVDPDGQLVEYYAELDRIVDEETGYFDPKPWHRDRPQKPKVWDPMKPRDMWGLPPTPAFISHAK
jgi:catechol 2,3-dioxygenase-like lactoylglutathione lyase family enzyme